MERERIIVLRKTPYSENSLIIAAFAEQCGRIDFLVKGALKKHPCIDLFRVIEIGFKVAKSSNLQNVYDLELIEQFDAVADCMQSFMGAGEMAKFLLKNLHHDLSCPLTFTAFRNILSVLARKENMPSWDADFCLLALKTVFLKENGMLPDVQHFNHILQTVDSLCAIAFDCRAAAAEIEEICIFNHLY